MICVAHFWMHDTYSVMLAVVITANQIFITLDLKAIFLCVYKEIVWKVMHFD